MHYVLALAFAALMFCLVLIYRQEKILDRLVAEKSRERERRDAPAPRRDSVYGGGAGPYGLYADRSVALGGAYTTPETRAYYQAATIPERRWQKVGVLTGDNDTLNLYSRPTTYNDDMWQYRVEDKDGFFVDIGEMQTLKTGNVVYSVPGKSSITNWKVNIYKRDSIYF